MNLKSETKFFFFFGINFSFHLYTFSFFSCLFFSAAVASLWNLPLRVNRDRGNDQRGLLVQSQKYNFSVLTSLGLWTMLLLTQFLPTAVCQVEGIGRVSVCAMQ